MIVELPLDCLARDNDGAAVLVYDNHKAHRLGRRLPISEPPPNVIPPSSSVSATSSPAPRPAS